MMEKLDVQQLTQGITEDWKNFPVALINDHVVRLSVLEKDFHWHQHTQSDEFFYVISGELFVDFENKTEILTPGQMIKVPKGVVHRTRANNKTTLLCFETKDNDVLGEQ